jgi:putative transposon-encoded protein
VARPYLPSQAKVVAFAESLKVLVDSQYVGCKRYLLKSAV